MHRAGYALIQPGTFHDRMESPRHSFFHFIKSSSSSSVISRDFSLTFPVIFQRFFRLTEGSPDGTVEYGLSASGGFILRLPAGKRKNDVFRWRKRERRACSCFSSPPFLFESVKIKLEDSRNAPSTGRGYRHEPHQSRVV